MSSSSDSEEMAIRERSTNNFSPSMRQKGENCNKKRKLKKNEPEDSTPGTPLRPLSAEQSKSVSELLTFQAKMDKFWGGNTKDIPRNFPLGKSKQDAERQQQHFMQLVVNELSLFKVFLSLMPGSSLIPEEDRSAVLQRSSNALLLLRWARNYDSRKDAVTIHPSRPPYTRTNFIRYSHIVNPEAIFHLLKKLHDLQMDSVELALIQAAIVFTDCPGLSKPEEVRKRYNRYLRTLWSYAAQKSPKRVWEMQSALNELRSAYVPMT